MLINLRNALMAGKRLPYDAEVEYLESTGTQYIDTGIVADSSLDCRLLAQATQITTQRIGALVTSPSVLRHHISVPESSSILSVVGFGNTTYDIRRSLDSKAHEWKLISGLLSFDGTTVHTYSAGIFSCGINWMLFARNYNGTPNPASMRIFACRLWRNGILVRDYIPVRKGAVGYLYDRVSGKLFGNAGTGDFVLGQDVVPVEYIESHGTEYIDTGYTLSGPTTFKLSASFTPTRDERDFFGAHAANAQGATVCGCYHNFVFGFNYPHPRIDGESLGSSEVTTDIEYALGQSSRTLKVNGTTYSGNGATFPNLAVTLFRGNSNTAYYGQFKCYAFPIYDANDVPVRSFRPVRVGSGSTWEGAMMDVLTRRIYRNAGTGAFTYGNDLKYPIPAE